MEWEPIEKVWLNRDNDLVDLTLTPVTASHAGKASSSQKGEVLHTNERHPFLTQEQGFLPVSQLKAGMHILRADGSVGVVSNITVVPGSQVMYNLTVAHDHTYVVGIERWIVHNCSLNDVQSLIHNDPGLVKAAQQAGKSPAIQRDIDNLIRRYLEGNENPGIGNGNLFGDINYLRSRNGARVFFRIVGDAMQILGKSNKANEQVVIDILTRLYGP
ncbi:MAG TPA: polymorphic toxin-type HINT domain-containing protein [Ktedonobacteraceae bacterium]|nr:polymorphic toxin-type HINT domain-containing protein [Ktedonobacteraceae bacterium]